MVLRSIIEHARCAKHNLLDHASFSVSFRGGYYYVRTSDDVQLRFRHNPYQPFYELTAGYLRDSAWPITAGMYVIDAGAYHGEFALYASRCVGPAGRVIALEPDPESFVRLCDSFALNGGVPPNVDLLNAGLWKCSGELVFSAGKMSGSHIVYGGAGAVGQTDSGSVLIHVHSLPDLVSRYQLTRLDYVKMDIEGAEIEAIQGASSMLSNFKPRFAIASYHIRNGRPTAADLEPFFRESGYTVITGFPTHLTTYAFPTSTI
jgi:FkbM family methyltransferase